MAREGYNWQVAKGGWTAGSTLDGGLAGWRAGNNNKK
jgi:hypothetical protein